MDTKNKKRSRVWRPALYRNSAHHYEQVHLNKKHNQKTDKKDALAFVVDWQLPTN